MKLKLNKGKFLRNIIIGVVSLIIVALIINYAPGYKRDKYKDMLNLVIGDENVTENLKYQLYKDENEIVYMSKEDISNLFDTNIYYDESSKTLITTSNTKVASMELGKKQIIINGAVRDTLGTVLEKEGILYVPISELELVYNISINTSLNSNIVIIDYLNEGMIVADVARETSLRYKSRSLSKEVGKVEKGEKVSCFYTTSKGWRLIRTSEGTLGYVKANTLANEYIIRQDMNDRLQTQKVKANLLQNVELTINNEKIKVINSLFEISSIGLLEINEELLNNAQGTGKIWATISNDNLVKQSNSIIQDYKSRTLLIDNIVNLVIKYDIKGININFNKLENIQAFNRFIIELAPRLREIGVSTNVILTENLNETDYAGIADFVIEK